ncbi:MAG: hypothetical protein R3F60_27435 [bacterium]
MGPSSRWIGRSASGARSCGGCWTLRRGVGSARVVASLLQTWATGAAGASPLAVVPLEEAQRRAQPGDGVRQRMRRLLARLRRQATRRVPSRITARIHLEPALTEAAIKVAGQ